MNQLFYINFFQQQMGCEPSTEAPIPEPSDSPTEPQEFKLTYRQFISNSRGQVFKFYHFSTLLHRSPSSAIRKVFHRTNNIERVCKIVGVDSLREFSCLQEIEFLKAMDHPNVERIQEYFIEKNFVYLIFEKINGFSLEQGSKHIKQISLASILSIMKQLFSALNMMHSQNIAHRNVHPGHIMLIPKKEDYIVKLIDFSWSAYTNSPKMKVPRVYRLGKVYSSEEAMTWPIKHDVYCCGLVFLGLLGGEAELARIRGREQEVVNNIISKNKSLGMLAPLLTSMLHSNPQSRPSISQILHSQIFTETQPLPHTKILLQTLLKYNITDRLKSTLWMFATIKLYTFHSKIELMNQFYYLDKNKDGKIQLEELVDGLGNIFKMGRAEAEAQAALVMDRIDKNSNGELDFYQFAMGAYLIGRNLSDAELRVLFGEIDTNKDGVISAQELDQAVEGVEEFELLRNWGNKINFQEFKDIMKSFITRIS